MWECPEFFALDGGHVLIYSTLGKVFWESGALDEATMKFTSRKRGLLDLDAFYAPKTQLDAEGRRILWGWIPERRSEAAMREAGWVRHDEPAACAESRFRWHPAHQHSSANPDAARGGGAVGCVAHGIVERFGESFRRSAFPAAQRDRTSPSPLPQSRPS